MTSTAGDVTTPGQSARSERAPRPGVWLTELSLLLMAMIWGVNFTVVKFATMRMHPLAFNAVRVTLAAVALAVIAALARGVWPSRRDALILFMLGMLGNGVYQVLFVEGISRTRAGDAALVVAATPAFIALLGRARGVDQIGGRGWLGILLSIAGIGLVTFGTVRGATGTATLLGDALILGGALCWAIYTVLLKPYTHEVDGLKLAAITMAGGVFPLYAVAWPSAIATDWGAVPGTVWVALTFSGIGALVVAYLFWYNGVRVIGPTRTAMYSNLQPLFAVTVAWLVLGELPTVWQGVGAASITSGLLLTRT
jgi:drug/metabolite transporter (DMT)-like permease